MTTLQELIIKRPCMKLEFLDVLLDFTSHEKSDVSADRFLYLIHSNTNLATQQWSFVGNLVRFVACYLFML